MKNPKVFLLSMEIGGIKNLEKPVHISFYNETITNKFDSSKFKIKGIYGENGVGKSALMSGVDFYRGLALDSRYLSNPINDRKIKHLLNKKNPKAKFCFEFLLNMENEIYIFKHQVELSININNIVEIVKEEGYARTPSTGYGKIYTVTEGDLVFSEHSKSDEVVELTKNTLKERTLLSSLPIIAKKIKLQNKDLNNMFYCASRLYVYLNNNDEHNDYLVRECYENLGIKANSLVGSIPLKYITCTDRSVVLPQDMPSFRKFIKKLTKFIKIYKPELKDIEIDEKINKDEIWCALRFRYDGYTIDGEFESTGIKKLVELYIAFQSVSHGFIVFIDELDSNIHDYYLCRLLEYVAEYTDGQLCFTSHNLGPMEVLKEYKKSIDFLSRDGEIVPWIKNGNYNVAIQYKEGKIKNFPFNIDSFDYIKVFGDDEK